MPKLKLYKFWLHIYANGKVIESKFGCVSATNMDEASAYLKQHYTFVAHGLQAV